MRNNLCRWLISSGVLDQKWNPKLSLVSTINLIVNWYCNVWMCVLYQNPNHCIDQDKIWYWGGPQGREGSGGVSLVPPTPGYGVCKGGMGCLWNLNHVFWWKLYKTIVARRPWFGPQIWIWKNLGPISFCSHGQSLWRGVHKIKVQLYVPNSYLVRLYTLYPDPQGPGGPKGGLSGVLEPQ